MVQWHYQGFTSQQRYLARLIQTLCPGSNQNKVHQFDRHLHLHQYLHYIKNSGNMSQFLKCNILEKVSSLLTAMTWKFLHRLNSSSPLLFALNFAVSAASTRWYSYYCQLKNTG